MPVIVPRIAPAAARSAASSGSTGCTQGDSIAASPTANAPSAESRILIPFGPIACPDPYGMVGATGIEPVTPTMST